MNLMNKNLTFMCSFKVGLMHLLHCIDDMIHIQNNAKSKLVISSEILICTIVYQSTFNKVIFQLQIIFYLHQPLWKYSLYKHFTWIYLTLFPNSSETDKRIELKWPQKKNFWFDLTFARKETILTLVIYSAL